MPFVPKQSGQPIQILPEAILPRVVMNKLGSLGFEWKEVPELGCSEMTHVYIEVGGRVRCVGTVERVFHMSMEELSEEIGEAS